MENKTTATFWRRHLFTLVIVGGIQFVVLTLLAMLFYPGGTKTDPTTPGYSFFRNFFSELGLTRGYAGQPNTISMVLFVVALTVTGIGLALFFAGFTQFFRRSLSGRILSRVGACIGVISGLCFIGVAFVPMGLHLQAHRQLVLWAFQTFTVAVLLYAVAIFREPGYPKKYAGVFVAFGALLVAYVLLLIVGPETNTAKGLMIQATGQKVIVYASVISVLIEAIGAKRMSRELAVSE